MKKNASYFKTIFDTEMNSGKKIFTMDKSEELVIDENERWKQCYKAGDTAREQLPPYWFISDRGNLISVCKGKAYWLKKDDSNGSGRYSYHCNIYTDDEISKKKNIELHNLVNIVFGGLTYGKAKSMLKEQGFFAFGVKNNKETKLNGHHMFDKKDSRPESTEIVSTDAHIIIDKIPKTNDLRSTKDYLKAFKKMAVEEEPNKLSLLLTGQEVDPVTQDIVNDDGSRILCTTTKLKMPDKVLNTLTTLENDFRDYWMIDQATQLLLKQYGIDYFSDPVYLSTPNSFFKVEKISISLEINEITDLRELIDKNVLSCVITEENKLCLIDDSNLV